MSKKSKPKKSKPTKESFIAETGELKQASELHKSIRREIDLFKGRISEFLKSVDESPEGYRLRLKIRKSGDVDWLLKTAKKQKAKNKK